MTATERCFPFNGFYVYDDSNEAEEHLINCCKNATIADYNDVKGNSDLFTVMHVNCRSIVNKVTELETLLFSLNSKPDIAFFLRRGCHIMHQHPTLTITLGIT